ncbi:MAG: hypothetical protein P8J87_12225 [Verrucomicrobiales bacterium]|nr:hypothetical protein [Verrucomicrobiales bacterium]
MRALLLLLLTTGLAAAADRPPRTGLHGRGFTPEQEAYVATISASYLRWSRWFQPEENRYRDDGRPVISYDHDGKSISVGSGHGVRRAGLWSESEIIDFKTYPAKATKKVEPSGEEAKTLPGDRPLTTISNNGKTARPNTNR